MKTSLVLTLSFLLGFIVDIFSDTPGVNSLSCTLLAMSRKPILYAYVSKDDKTKEIIPCISDLGISVYSKFLLSVSFLYCLMVFAIEFFNFADIQDILIMSASSGLLTFLLLLGVDCLFNK